MATYIVAERGVVLLLLDGPKGTRVYRIFCLLQGKVQLDRGPMEYGEGSLGFEGRVDYQRKGRIRTFNKKSRIDFLKGRSPLEKKKVKALLFESSASKAR